MSASEKPDHQPIQEQYQDAMRVIGKILDEALNPTGTRINGFALLVFPFGQPNGEHRANYLSNANREDMLATMKEFIARAEGRYHDPGANG